VQHVIRSSDVWHVQLLGRFLQTDSEYNLFRLLNQNTDVPPQRTLIPPRYVTPPLVLCSPNSEVCVPYSSWEIDHSSFIFSFSYKPEEFVKNIDQPLSHAVEAGSVIYMYIKYSQVKLSIECAFIRCSGSEKWNTSSDKFLSPLVSHHPKSKPNVEARSTDPVILITIRPESWLLSCSGELTLRISISQFLNIYDYRRQFSSIFFQATLF
jgi:hypothetical protein